jgi:MFS family permease
VFQALRSRDFRLLWLSQSASVIGDSLVIVAIGLFVTRLTGNASDVGLVLAAYAIPLVVLLLFGGVLADRLPRQRVMITTDLVRATLHGTLAVLIATGTVRIWHMIVIGVLFGSTEAFFRPAYTGLVPQTVAESDIQSAQALGGVSNELAAFASPALATALVLGIGGGWAFGLDAATFLLSAAVLTRVGARSRGAATQRTSVVHELGEGWAAVRSRPWVWGTIAAFSATLLLALAPFLVLGAGVAKHVYGTEAVYGLTNAAWGIGTITGAVIGSRWRPARPMRTGLLGSLAWPVAIALFAAGPPLVVLYSAMAVAGVGIGMFSVWWETALAQRIPPHLLSRVSAWDWMGSMALLPLGYLLAGWLAELIGDVRLTLIGGGLGFVACLLGLVPASTRQLARFDIAEAHEVETLAG